MAPWAARPVPGIGSAEITDAVMDFPYVGADTASGSIRVEERCLRTNKTWSSSPMVATLTSRAEDTAIFGVRLNWISVNIFTGKVVAPGDCKNRDITVSSMETENAKSAPEIRPGRMMGRYTCRRMESGPAPRLCAERTRAGFSPARLARVVRYTYGVAMTACARPMGTML